MTDPMQPSDDTPPPAETYDLEPPAPVVPSKLPNAPVPAPQPQARLDAAPLMDDLDDDADLTADPEVERALHGTPTVDAESPEPAAKPLGPAFVTAGRGSSRTVAIIGAGVGVVAVLIACLAAEKRWYAAGIATAYLTLFHTGTGVLAVGLAAHLHGASIGRIDLAASRMLLAVASFMMVLHLQPPGPVWLTKSAATLVAALVYTVVVWALFRPTPVRLRALLASHAGLAGLLWLVVTVHTWASDMNPGEP